MTSATRTVVLPDGAVPQRPRSTWRALLWLAACAWLAVFAPAASAQDDIPLLSDTVNDFAGVVDAPSRAQMDTLIRSLQQTTGDAVVVATIKTFKPYGDLNEYAVKMFENHGRGIGQKGKSNGVLVVLAVDDRRVRVEVGYDLEQFVTDGFSGETSREFMAPQFRNQQYGAGLLAGVTRIIGRIAEGRNVTLEGVRPVSSTRRRSTGSGVGGIIALFILFLVVSSLSSTRRGRRRGWYNGVGPFGGGFGGGFGGFGGGGFGGGFGGGGGGGFGGFGGGSSGGGGGGASW